MQDSRICASCGRRFHYHARWRNNWDEVKYCSRQCQRNKPGRLAAELEQAILTLLGQRARGASICPSEVARARQPENWKPLMEPVRQAARRLAARGQLLITQKNQTVDPHDFRGPVRLRLPG